MKCVIVLNTLTSPEAASGGAANCQTMRKDYLLLSESLNAPILYPDTALEAGGWVNRLGSFLRQAWHAFRRCDEYDVVISMSEQVGLVLALLFKLARCNKPHLMISHYMTPVRKSVFIKLFRVDTHIMRFICYGSAQAIYLTKELGVPEEKVKTVLHPVDSTFWKPLPVPSERVIVSAGMLARDYDTLLKATAGLDVDVVIAAASPWVPDKEMKTDRHAPERVRFVKCSPAEMRELYSRALFVVVPLMPVNIHAGSLVIYESMAMGKAVVTSANGGNLDIVREGETGRYVPAQDPEALRAVITELLDNPQEAERMGARAREVVEHGLHLDRYVEEVTRVVRETYRDATGDRGPGRP